MSLKELGSNNIWRVRAAVWWKLRCQRQIERRVHCCPWK